MGAAPDTLNTPAVHSLTKPGHGTLLALLDGLGYECHALDIVDRAREYPVPPPRKSLIAYAEK